jgi:uncharacterized membrane protein
MKWYKTGLQILLAVAMIVIGAIHFTDPEPFVKIVAVSLICQKFLKALPYFCICVRFNIRVSEKVIR